MKLLVYILFIMIPSVRCLKTKKSPFDVNGPQGLVQALAAVPPSVSYSGNPFIFLQNKTIGTVSPFLNGLITGCTVSPSLPKGIGINSSCTLTGIPTETQSSASYTVTAAGATGTASASISIGVNYNPKLDVIIEQAALGVSSAETTSTFGSLGGTVKWAGGVYAPNGKIYGIPHNSTTVLVINPAANSASTFGSLAGGAKWHSGVLAPSGKIYGIPASSTSVLVIDPSTDTTYTFGSLSGTAKWTGG
ncbi:MAG TPA: hypothetical protein PKK94_20180, partial [Leptospiraceae bacterium]|nr:hypothetical protein [Leptospiraceae bacterium]